MRRRSFYVGVAVAYAVAVYAALALSQDRAEREIIALALVLVFSVAAGSVGWRFASGLQTAVREAERGREELAIVGRLSAGLSGPLTPQEVARAFLDGISGLVSASAIATLFQYEETAESVRILAQQGAAPLAGERTTYPIGALPPAIRTKLIGEKRSFVLDDVATDPDWPAFAAAIPGLAGARSFAALPLISRSRLIGALTLVDPKPHGLVRDQLQILALLGQYVAGALHNALSIAEADERADREAVVNRITQRMYANLDPEAVVGAALEELGTELGVSRVLISSASETDLTVLHEWDAPGVSPTGIGARGRLPLSALAARDGRTIACL